MQVGRVGVPAVTHEGEHLTAVDLVAFMHLQGIRLEVGIEGEVAVTDVYDHEVPELLQQVIALGKVRRRLFGSAVLEVYDRTVGDREHLGPDVGIARQLVQGTGLEYVVSVQLAEVDREPLEGDELPVDRQRGRSGDPTVENNSRERRPSVALRAAAR